MLSLKLPRLFSIDQVPQVCAEFLGGGKGMAFAPLGWGSCAGFVCSQQASCFPHLP